MISIMRVVAKETQPRRMFLSSVGRKQLAGHAAFLLVDIIVLALSSRVNDFQDFFYLFPFALSIISLVLVFISVILDLALDNSYTGRPQVKIGLFGVLSIFWLAFNAFSTARWRQIPFQCDSIPPDFPDERVWCKDLQALKSFVWVNFVLCLCITFVTVRYSFAQYSRGNKHIFQSPLSRYHPELGHGEGISGGRGSEFLQFEKLT
ncbi:hypothetical protein B0H34DRAFT_532340 [Crassisporium funariophilum]|nr:hypothetical protein B0H34DRAFT_532340 [Crassisporium funariophilum]